jgi:adenine-specific DNA-methyltransferase
VVVAKRSSGRAGRRSGTEASRAGKPSLPLGDIRHPGAKRRNIPPAKIAAEGTVPVIPKAQYAYNPHLPPVLRFDQHGGPDALPELIAEAGKRPLTPDEQRLLAEALRRHEPWLEWTGKREKPGFAVDPVALHIHERISAQAILKVAARQDASKFLFADPEQEYHEAVQFYRHEVDWSNRLILGDSLQVMSSLARREDLAGKVQMIYMDPPYGIKFASNFQPEVGKRDVKDKQEDLTREPEMVKAYRDTWHLGIHSYLSYLRDRLIVARELLADTGSIFVQISDENMHRVRQLMDEVLGPDNFMGCINYQTMTPLESGYIENVFDYLLWYSRDRDKAKYRNVWVRKPFEGSAEFKFVQGPGFWREVEDTDLQNGAFKEDLVSTIFKRSVLESSGFTTSCMFEFPFEGRPFFPRGGKSWRTNTGGMARLFAADRLFILGTKLYFKMFHLDFGYTSLLNTWTDTVAGFADTKAYVVQTHPKIVQRCMLMTTDPGDLVLDPTCGSGTTAYVAEQWGRRWITIDTSRVAVAIARQRLLTAKFEQYKTKAVRKDSRGQDVPDPSSGFVYRTVPHITLKSIAQNVALDPIFARHEPLLEAALKRANNELAAALKKDPSIRTRLAAKLAKKEREEGKRAVTDADRRRWVLPPDNREKGVKWTIDPTVAAWYHWEVPFDTDPEWPKPLAEAVTAYRAAWRAKMDEVNACIAASAEQEELVDQPEIVKGVTRVSGPFTVEAVQPPEMSLGDVIDAGDEGGFAGAPDELEGRFEVRMVETRADLDAANLPAYLDQMFRYIRADGVRFLNNRQMRWTRLEPLFESSGARTALFHAEGRWAAVGEEDRDPEGPSNVGVVFGPQYGPVTAKMVEEIIRPAGRLYDHLVIAAFNFTGEAQAILGENPHPKLRIHFAHIRPDINPGMNGLLKESPQPGGGQLFTVFGQPRISVRRSTREEGLYEVEMEGVDIYDPVKDEIRSSTAGKVAAWFLDGDYDGRTFCVTQAFFPDRSAWEKLARALNGKNGPIDAERFEAFSGTTSLPFAKGKHGCVAVKVIDPRGNEVMAVERLT